MSDSARPGWRRTALHAARALVGAALALGAAMLLLHGRRQFERLGVPDGFRIALGVAELAAGVLFAIPRTMPFGAVALLVVLAWAAGLHSGLRQPAGQLYLFMLVVAVLAHVPTDSGPRAAGPPR
jgi:hypothetical protein